tara:strand:+ start:394 stop:507 length:114 start_codon:yes stop_codon:yes gene_type:complete
MKLNEKISKKTKIPVILLSLNATRQEEGLLALKIFNW